MQLSPLRQFILASALWLPFAFLLWWVLLSAILWPVAQLTGWISGWLLPHTIVEVEQHGFIFQVVTNLLIEDSSGRLGQRVLEFRPSTYSWPLALFGGLVFALPISGRRKLVQLALGFCALTLVTTWGAMFDIFHLLQRLGPLGDAVLAQAGLTPGFVAFGYQFGYLILPPVTPIVLWIGLNSAFLQELVEFSREPNEPPAV